jgi:hypothetical protein
MLLRILSYVQLRSAPSHVLCTSSRFALSRVNMFGCMFSSQEEFVVLVNDSYLI